MPVLRFFMSAFFPSFVLCSSFFCCFIISSLVTVISAYIYFAITIIFSVLFWHLPLLIKLCTSVSTVWLLFFFPLLLLDAWLGCGLIFNNLPEIVGYDQSAKLHTVLTWLQGLPTDAETGFQGLPDFFYFQQPLCFHVC